MTSANVVGYQEIETQDGFTYVTPTFEKVDGSEPTFGDLVPAGDDAGWGGTEIIQTFDTEDGLAGYYVFYNEGMGYGPTGWYDEEQNCVNDLPIGGKGIGMIFESAACPLRFCGAVGQGEQDLSGIQSGLTYVGNCTPIDHDIQDFKVTGDGAGWGGTEIIQTFDEGGGLVDYLVYWDEGMGYGDTGWYNESNERVELPVPAGRAFIFESDGSFGLQLPASL